MRRQSRYKKFFLLKFIVLVIFLLLVGCNTAAKKEQNVLSQLGIDVSSFDEAVEQGDLAAREGEPDKAVFFYTKALEFNKNSVTALSKIGAIHYARSDMAMAGRAYQRVVELEPNNAPAHQFFGLAHMKLRNSAKAKQELSRATQLNPHLWLAFNGLGILADMDGDYLQALSYYQSALAVVPRNPMVLNNIGYY